MAKNTNVSCTKGAATQITDAAVTAARVVSTANFYLLATTGTTAPTSTAGGIPMLGHSILAADLTLENLFPGVGASLYLWAWPTSSDAVVAVSHA